MSEFLITIDESQKRHVGMEIVPPLDTDLLNALQNLPITQPVADRSWVKDDADGNSATYFELAIHRYGEPLDGLKTQMRQIAYDVAEILVLNDQLVKVQTRLPERPVRAKAS